ncbi:membrane protein [Bryobacterales bacterium F-183]|nr:membrane protein [Bryobacterales bacterium F-183]
MSDSAASDRKAPSEGKLVAWLMVMIFFWSLNFVISKIALRELPALFIVGIRNLVAGLVVLPLYLWERRTQGPATWTWQQLPILFFLGFLGIAMNQLLFVLGIERTTVAHAAVILGLAPVSTLLIAILMGQERMNGKRLIGMAIAIAGIGVLQLAHAAENGGKQSSLVGDFFIYCAGIAYALFTVLGRKYTRQHSSITMNAIAYVGSGLTLLPLSFIAAQGLDLYAISWRAWASVFYMAAFSSVAGYLILYWVLRWMPASRVGMYVYAQPVMATVLGILLLHESPGAALYAGGALVLAGVLVSERL